MRSKYVKWTLSTDESIVYETKLHWMMFAWRVFFMLVLLLGVSQEANEANLAYVEKIILL